ncbi:uncharacterized protein LOC8286002 isoform X2 [Ricinus communis]|uniref:uncharacterized protein LOC8286002 isoform X2 n=1 Tax=Ricinus communis TaxID=3988 RepID=UPI00201B2F44|nr:uncharacterized protein LOC8286002 isoform X2 [Ricinus communis]
MDTDQDEYPTFAEGRETRYSHATNGARKGYVVYQEMGFQDQVKEFLKGAAEMSVQCAKGCRDIVVQNLGREDSFIVKNFGRSSYIGKKVGFGYDRICKKLKKFNEYLPEDKDPIHAWSVICAVFVLAFAVLSVSTERDTSTTLIKKVFIHPPSADRILLPDGRYMAYREQGVPADSARFSMIAPHTFLSSRLAGAAMLAPMVNPYDSLMTKDERRGIWEKWTRKRKFMYFLARRFPMFLSYFYHRSFLSGKHDQIDTWLSLSLGKRDKALIEDPIHEDFWQRDVEESIRQGNAKPFIEEAVLQVSNWGFSLADIKLQKKKQGKGVLNWLKLVLVGSEEEYTGFLGPIHIWQGMDDKVVPPLMTDFVHRVLPGAAVHKLPYEGHFTYFYFCDECHQQIFTTLFGTPQGPLKKTAEVKQTPYEDSMNVQEVDDENEALVSAKEIQLDQEEQVHQTLVEVDIEVEEEVIHTKE